MIRKTTVRMIGHGAVIMLGWLLVLVGIAALFLPGPGMLMIFGGVYLLSRHHSWARYLLRPVKLTALLGAAEGVEQRWRIVASCLGALCIGAFGVLWLVQPDAPGWWPVPERWWLVGGRTVGVTLVASCLIALTLIYFSVRRFYGHPEAVAELRVMLKARKRAVARIRQLRRERHQARHHGPGPVVPPAG
ncbi:PGPGW domain-containing protein [Propionibacteriaceae bacterium Y1923]|uniref:PGPGW domain-containing protein n=1 Tax=Aestuariimicrobium sp. Y1814 TaxID=3418742 RepID=UPI003C23DFFB